MLAWFALVACKEEPPPLRSAFGGDWTVTFSVADGDPRDGAMALTWDEEEQQLLGEVTMEDPDEERVYGILEGEDIEDLGVALMAIELAGVRQLFFELAPPEGDATFGGWRTRWGCDNRQCGEDGGLEMAR